MWLGAAGVFVGVFGGKAHFWRVDVLELWGLSEDMCLDKYIRPFPGCYRACSVLLGHS